jgi:hypothetical protein
VSRYEVDKTLCKEEYHVFDSREQKYIAENLKKLDAEFIVNALNHYTEYLINLVESSI